MTPLPRRVLMIAFYFPPYAQSTGGQRVLAMAKHLPHWNWHPTILTARASVHSTVDLATLSALPDDLTIERAGGFDAARDLAWRGRYPRMLATPDRWTTWAVAATWRGLRWIKRFQPAAIWATFPVPSCLLVGCWLHRLTGVPLVVDLRDPMVYEHWPDGPTLRRAYARIERAVIRDAAALTVTTEGAQALYRDRYPHLPADRITVVPNGINDALAAQMAVIRMAARKNAALQINQKDDETRPLKLIHGGLIEIPDRDPTALFQAVALLHARGALAQGTLTIVLRASGRDDALRAQAHALGVAPWVEIAPRLPHAQALEEMCFADGLLLLQGAACNRQVPAKAYEYLAAQQSIVGLCDPAGDTDRLLRSWSVPYRAPLSDPASIAEVLKHFIADSRQRRAFVPAESLVGQHLRSAGARQTAGVLDAASRVPA